jgi:ATP-dependent DNA helicase RecG
VSRWTSEGEAFSAVRRAVQEGRQAYVVFPLVEESERLDLKAVLKGWEHLKAAFPDIDGGVVARADEIAEKEAVMGRLPGGKQKFWPPRR